MPSCGSSAKARTRKALRVLVFLRDGLTTDSTGRILPEVRRAAEVFVPPRRPYHSPPVPGQIVASLFYHIRAGVPIDSLHDRAR